MTVAAQSSAATGAEESVGRRLAYRARWIVIRGLACAITGAVVFGVGGRLVMLASRLIHPEAIGRFTENGFRIGEFTLAGTLELLVFGGLLSGLAAGVVWVVVKDWLPGGPVVVGVAAAATGSPFLIHSDNRDFDILGDPVPDLVLLFGLVFLFGVTLVYVDRRLDGALPPARGPLSIVVFAVLALLGMPMVFPVTLSMFSREFCFCAHPPTFTGVFFVLAGLATLIWWVEHLAGAETPSRPVRLTATATVALAVVSGIVHMTGEVLRIL